jgi:hypothetical protein
MQCRYVLWPGPSILYVLSIELDSPLDPCILGGSGTFVQKVTVGAEDPCASRHCGDSNRRPHYWFGEFLQREMQYATEIDVPGNQCKHNGIQNVVDNGAMLLLLMPSLASRVSASCSAPN